MGRRLYKMGRDTHAKGETFEHEDRDRYYINVSLLSLKTLEDYDIGKGGEFYFKAKRNWQGRRIPDRGEIYLMQNQVFTARQDFTLWTEFIELEQGDSKDIELEVALYERDLKWDKKVFEVDVPIKLGTQTKYIILEDEKGNTKAKVKIAATRTRY